MVNGENARLKPAATKTAEPARLITQSAVDNMQDARVKPAATKAFVEAPFRAARVVTGKMPG